MTNSRPKSRSFYTGCEPRRRSWALWIRELPVAFEDQDSMQEGCETSKKCDLGNSGNMSIFRFGRIVTMTSLAEFG
jgi:hypothetical protein